MASPLDELEKALSDPQKMLDLAAKSIAEEALGLIAEGFRTETDPYGRKWAPKQAQDGRKTLSGKTSRLKNGWKYTRVSSATILISPSVDYAAHHQNPRERAGGHGLKRPRRMMVPDVSEGMPKKWDDALEEAATDAIEAFLGQGDDIAALRRKLAEYVKQQG